MKRSPLVLMLMLLGLHGRVAIPKSSTPFPDTPAGRQLAAWESAFNTGDRKMLDRYLLASATEEFRRNMPTDQQLQDQQYVGRFDLAGIEKSASLQLTAQLKADDTGDLFEIVLGVTHDAKHKLDSISLSPGPNTTIVRMTDSELKKALGSRLDRWAEQDRFSGVVLLAKHEEIIFNRAYGYSDRTKKEPNTLETRFRIGSIDKQFTAIAILQLVQEGKIKLDDKVGAYLKDLPNRAIAEKVTIHELLTHTGGTGDFFGPEYLAKRGQLNGIDDYLAIDPNRQLTFEPGSQTRYSNYGYVLLGSIIEHVSGRRYYDFIREHVYAPAGMNASDSPPESEEIKGRSVGYTKPLGTTAWVAENAQGRASSAGGSLSTAQDMLRFSKALLDNKLLSAGYTNLAITAKPIPEYRGPPLGYGFADLRGPDGSGWVGGNGGAPGQNAHLRIYPKSGYVIVALSNLDPPAADRVADFIDRRLTQ